MKTRLIRIGLLGLAILAACGVWLLFSSKPSNYQGLTTVLQAKPDELAAHPLPNQTRSPQPPPKTVPTDDMLRQKMAEGTRAKEAQERAFLNLFATPINFWGQVIDDKGNPVQGALVKLGTADRPWETGTRYQRTTDANGLFSITDVNGLSISVHVSKEGYYATPRSRGQFSYAEPLGNRVPLPTSKKPAMFELRKMGAAVPLIHHIERCFRLAKDGSAVEVDLETGRVANPGHLKVQCWTHDQSKDDQGRYDWKCRVTVPGGGLTERTGPFDFEAPTNGYQGSIELTPPLEKWAANVEREFFIRLPDDRYARMAFDMRAGGEHFFVIESYLNPTPGSRNLEYDPSGRNR